MIKLLILAVIVYLNTYSNSFGQICNIDHSEKILCDKNYQDKKVNDLSIIDDISLLKDYLQMENICNPFVKPNVVKSMIFNTILGTKKQRTSIEEDKFGNGEKTKDLLKSLKNNKVPGLKTQLVELCGIKTMFLKKSDSDETNKFAIIFSGSHGTAEKYLPILCSAYTKKGYTCIIFNYRGFGGQYENLNLYSGTPNFQPNPYSIVEDAMTVLKYIPFSCQDAKNKKIEIILHGYSLGGYVLSSVINFLANEKTNAPYGNIKNSISKIIFDRPMVSLEEAIQGGFQDKQMLARYVGRISSGLVGKMHSLKQLPLVVKDNDSEYSNKIKTNFHIIIDSKNHTVNNELYFNTLHDSQRKFRDENKDIFKAVNTYRIDNFNHLNSYPSYKFLDTEILNK